MKKFYLLLLPLFIWGTTAKAAPLEGYEAPTLPKEGNVGNIVSFTTSGALEDLQNINIPKTPTGKMAQELIVSPGTKIDFSIKINTFWGRFAVFSDANENKDMSRLILCGNPGQTTYEDATNGILVYTEDTETKVEDGTLPSITIPQTAEEGTTYLLRMMFFGTVDGTTEADWTYNGSYTEGTYYDLKITVKQEIKKYAINFSATNGQLSIKNGNTAITNGEEVAEGTLLSITATPNTGYELVSITNNDNIYASETFTVNSTANFVATFKELASDGDGLLMSAPGYGDEECQLRFSDAVLGEHNSTSNQVASDQRSRNYTFSAWISPMGYNGAFMGHVQNNITWAVEGSYGIGVKEGKITVWYRKWDGNSTACPGVNEAAISETTFYPGEFAFISLVTSNDGKNFKVYKNGEEVLSQNVEDGGLALLYDECDFAIGDSKYNQMPSKVEEVQVWNKTLSAEEIKASMYGYTEIPEGLVAYYLPEAAETTTIENLAGDQDAYYRKNGTLSNNNFPIADAIAKTNGRTTVDVSYNTPEDGATYEIHRFGKIIGNSPAPVKTYSNLKVLNTNEDAYLISGITVNDRPIEGNTFKVDNSPINLMVTFEKQTVYTIHYSISAHGTIQAYKDGNITIASGETVAENTPIIIAVTPEENYELSSVTINNNPIDMEDTDLVTNVDGIYKIKTTVTEDMDIIVTLTLHTDINNIRTESSYFSNNILHITNSATAIIYNMLGTEVGRTSETVTDLNSLPTGIYVAKITLDGNQSIIRFKKL